MRPIVHFRTLRIRRWIFLALLSFSVPALAGPPAGIHFALAGIAVDGTRESRTFRVQAGRRVMGVLTIACQGGEIVSAGYDPRAGATDRSGEVARAADGRLCGAERRP